MRYALGLSMLCACCLAGCANTGTTGKTHDASMEWRMKSIEESFLDFREQQKKQVDEQTQANAELKERLDEYGKRLAAIEPPTAVEKDSKKAVVDDGGWVSDLKAGEGDWKEVKPESESSQPAATEPAVSTSGEAKPWASVPGEPSKKEAAGEKTQPTAPQPASAQATYESGLSLYNANQFAKAREAFESYLQRFPKTKLAANALYWKGETFYSQKNYAQAIMTFKDVAQKYPKHSKVPAAMLKTGMAYEMSGDRDNAEVYLRALVEDYPKSSPAALARKRLASYRR